MVNVSFHSIIETKTIHIKWSSKHCLDLTNRKLNTGRTVDTNDVCRLSRSFIYTRKDCRTHSLIFVCEEEFINHSAGSSENHWIQIERLCLFLIIGFTIWHPLLRVCNYSFLNCSARKKYDDGGDDNVVNTPRNENSSIAKISSGPFMILYKSIFFTSCVMKKSSYILYNEIKVATIYRIEIRIFIFFSFKSRYRSFINRTKTYINFHKHWNYLMDGKIPANIIAYILK